MKDQYAHQRADYRLGGSVNGRLSALYQPEPHREEVLGKHGCHQAHQKGDRQYHRIRPAQRGKAARFAERYQEQKAEQQSVHRDGQRVVFLHGRARQYVVERVCQTGQHAGKDSRRRRHVALSQHPCHEYASDYRKHQRDGLVAGDLLTEEEPREYDDEYRRGVKQHHRDRRPAVDYRVEIQKVEQHAVYEAHQYYEAEVSQRHPEF